MATSHDVLRLKTDAELRFFVDNPTFYQSELVAAARQELRRRHPGPALPTAAPPPPSPPEAMAPAPLETDYEDAPRRATSWLLPASVAIVLLLAGAGFWGKTRHQPAEASAAHAPQVATPKPAAPRPLETAISAPPLPTYDAESYVEQALSRVPAAEKANEQHLSQYQAISRRFWAAQQPSAYLIQQVQAGKANPLFGAQSAIVLASWQEFDRTLIYSYNFRPVMGDHFRRMKAIASYQRAALTELSNTAAAHQPLHLVAAQLIAAQQELPGLLAPLLARR